MGSSSSLPGFRFYPTEEELINFYLRAKVEGRREEQLNCIIPVVDIFSCLDPWQLPKLAGDKCRKDQEQWFFFSPQQEREVKGGRPNRKTPSGYWKATGSPSVVYSSQNQVIGVKKTMVFYHGKAPVGKKTKWKVNEYRTNFPQSAKPGELLTPVRPEFSVCRVYVTSGYVLSFDRRPLPSPQPANHATNHEKRLMPTILPCQTSSHETTSSSGGHILHANHSTGDNYDHINLVDDGWSLQTTDDLFMLFGPYDFS